MQLAEEANLRLGYSLTLWTGGGSRMCCQGSLAFNFLACLSCSAAAVMFASQGGAPLNTVLSSAFPRGEVDGKRFHEDLQIVFEAFILPSL